jgi:DNA (cytosine-5)-methyltransferase 1
MYYGVPQSRQRMIFVGIRKDLEKNPSHPEAQFISIPVKAIIPNAVGTRSQKINPWISADQSAVTICKTNAGYELKESQIKETWQSYRVLTGQEKKKHFGLTRLEADKPSPTIVKDAGNTTTGMIHPYEIRKLTISEIKALASFHSDYQLNGNFHQKWARIGNSVPPLFMKAIAEHIRKNFLEGDGRTFEEVKSKRVA